MGFQESDIERALNDNGNDFGRALDYLITLPPPQPTAQPGNPPNPSQYSLENLREPQFLVEPIQAAAEHREESKQSEVHRQSENTQMIDTTEPDV